MDAERLRRELYDATRNRAMLYWFIYDELRAELGAEKAREILKRAVYRRGEQLGKRFARFAPADFAGLRTAFVGGIPDQGRMFAPQVARCDEGGLDIIFHACPLKSAWQEAGLSEQDCAELCEVAGVIDDGTFEGAGFAFLCDSLAKGSKESCTLRIRRK